MCGLKTCRDGISCRKVCGSRAEAPLLQLPNAKASSTKKETVRVEVMDAVVCFCFQRTPNN